MSAQAHRTRIPPVTEPDAEQQELLAKTLLGPAGQPLNLFGTLAHHPALLRRVNALGGLFMTRGLLDARTRELVILRVAHLTGSAYEAAQHRALGREAGLSANEISALEGVATAEWSEHEAEVLEAVEQLVRTRDLDDATWRALEGAMTSAELLELVALVGFYVLVATVLGAVGIEVEPWASHTT